MPKQEKLALEALTTPTPNMRQVVVRAAAYLLVTEGSDPNPKGEVVDNAVIDVCMTYGRHGLVFAYGLTELQKHWLRVTIVLAANIVRNTQ